MNQPSRRIFPAFVLSVLATGPLAAATVSLNPIKDATLYDDPTGSQSSGASVMLMTGRVGNNDATPLRRALLQFDLSSIPAGSVINSVSLTLQLTKLSNANSALTTLQRVTGSWTEGTTNAGPTGDGVAANPGDATWLHRSSPTAWTSPGGDFLGITSSSLNVSGLGSYTWTGAGLVTDVQFWLGSSSQNFGWILRGNEATPQSVKEFSSRQGTTAPVLLINFTPVPEASTAGLFLLTGFAFLKRRRLHA